MINRWDAGPGNLSRAMGINKSHNGLSLLGESFFMGDDGFRVDPAQIVATPRIGVDYAGEDALLPYRFILRDNPWVSKKNVFTSFKNQTV